MSLCRLPFSWGGGSSIELAGIPLRNVRPAKRSRPGIATNKAGRLVLVGDAPSGRVKIFEAMSPKHAEFISRLSGMSLVSCRFPSVLARSEQFIICEWVSGRPLSKMSLDANVLGGMARLQAKLHAFDMTPLPAPSFDYWDDLIVPRFVRASGLVGKTDFAVAVIAKVQHWRVGVGLTLNHPDITPSNVIAADGGYVVVDNELLYGGRSVFMDVLNTMRSLPEGSRSTYLDAYRREAGRDRLAERDVMEAFWLAREAGAAFVAARVGRVAKLLSDPAVIQEDPVLRLLGESK